MNYKTLFTNDEGQVIYACISDDGKSYSSCSEQDPTFQAWLADGNQPLPPDEPLPPPTTAEKIDQLLTDYNLTRDELRAAFSATQEVPES